MLKQMKMESMFLYWDDLGDNQLKFTTSTDHGVTWSTPFLIENGLEMEQALSPRIMINENNVIGVLWEDALDPVNIKFSTSNDNGQSFTFVDEFENSVGFDDIDLHYDNQGDTIAVTYSTSSIDEGQLISTSFDFGVTWNEPVILQNEIADGSTSNSRGTIEISGDNMYAIWNAQNGIQNLYFSNSTDHGATWSNPMKLSINEVVESDARLLVNEDTNNILIAWVESMGDIFQKISNDGGFSFGPATIIDDSSICGLSIDVGVGENMYTLWEDAVFPNMTSLSN